MGIVYGAQDDRHSRQVAIKVLRKEFCRAGVSERFLREIDIVTHLDHPNIVSLFDSGDAEGVPYYVMPLLDGDTLKDRLKRDIRLSVADVVNIANDIAGALAYAHKKKIVHRDVKPGNIMLTARGAVLLDFGVARVVAAIDQLTTSGIALGTLEYMSPEQSSGVAVDGRTDTYALACVTYEMLAGEPPFHAPDSAGIRLKQAVPPRPITDVRQDLPPAVQPVLEKALAPNAANRHATPLEFCDALQRALKERRPRKVVRWAAGAALIVAAVAAFLSPAGRRAVAGLVTRPSVAAPNYVAVLSFTSPDSADAVLAAGLTQSFTHLLLELTHRNSSVWVLSFEDMLEAGVSTPAALRRSYPVSLVVTGEVRNAGGKQSLKTELFEVRGDDHRLVSSQLIRDPSDSLSLASVRDLVSRALALPAPSASSKDSSALVAATPARLSYLLGVGHMQRPYDLASLTAAIDNFQAAVEQDTSFGAAYAGLCEALWERYMQTAQASTANDATQKCDRAGELSRSDPATLVALGRTQFFHGQLERAEQTLRSAIQQNAGADAHRWLGHVLGDLGRFDEAVREHRQAIALRPDIWIYYDALGMQYMNAERHQEAIELHRDVIRLSPDNYAGYSNLGGSLMLMHRLDEAEKELKRSIQVRPTALAYRNLGYLGLLRQRYDESITALREAIGYGPEDWWSWRWLAHAYHWRGDRAAEHDAWQRVVDLLKLRLGFNPTDQDMLCALAEASIALGDTELGLRSLDSLAAHPILRVYNLYLTGRVYEMLGRRRAALEHITQALARGFDSRTVANDPWLVALRTDPAYHGPR